MSSFFKNSPSGGDDFTGGGQGIRRRRRGGGGGGGGGFDLPNPFDSDDAPPFLSYDPGIAAEARAIERGVEDTRFDIRREKKRNRKDLKSVLRDLQTDLKRGKQDLRRERTRGLEDIEENREGVLQEAKRGFEDFDTALNNLVRSYATLGQVQNQAGNAAGIGGGGYKALAAQIRGGNMAVEKREIDVGRERLGEDLYEALGDIQTDEDRLLEDFKRSKRRLKKDVRHDERLTRRDFRRTKQDLNTDLMRALREGRISIADLFDEALFQQDQLR